MLTSNDNSQNTNALIQSLKDKISSSSLNFDEKMELLNCVQEIENALDFTPMKDPVNPLFANLNQDIENRIDISCESDQAMLVQKKKPGPFDKIG